LLERRLPLEVAHGPVLHLLPKAPARILDIGSGPGHDAAALAGLGHQVVAVEPVAELRLPAMALYPSRGIVWLNDHLPDLACLSSRGGTFDLVMLTAVWMHLDPGQRRQAMPRVAALLRGGGRMLISLRHGPVPQGRRMFEVTAADTVALARQQGLDLLLSLRTESIQEANRRAGVTWTRLAFAKALAGDR